MKAYGLRTYNTLLLALTLFLVVPVTTATASTRYQDDEEEELMTLPVHYYDRAQKEFGKQRWNEGKEIIDAGLKRFPDDSNLNTLAGKYWVHYEQWDKARFHLVKAINEYYNNVEAKQMLVSVEDITGNYSSAICYINELLEINPYWEGLWRKKIELYKKQGNTYEANRLFKRLQQIYPKNQEIKDAYYYELELEYARQSKAGNLVAKGDALRELTKLNPQNVDYQLALINHYYNANLLEKAIDQASLALAQNPGNIEILRRKWLSWKKTASTMLP
jgi:tetratricopeptide (TPR) repeat protein